jgi:hypothetical protein
MDIDEFMYSVKEKVGRLTTNEYTGFTSRKGL